MYIQTTFNFDPFVPLRLLFNLFSNPDYILYVCLKVNTYYLLKPIKEKLYKRIITLNIYVYQYSIQNMLYANEYGTYNIK